MKSRKLIFLVILTMILSISGFSFTGVAAVVDEFEGGTGTLEDPWLISNAVQLSNVRNYLGSDNTDRYFKLTKDIDLDIYPFNEGVGWPTIGNWDNGADGSFYGNFDGAGYTISNLYVNIASEDDNPSGLFGDTLNADIKNLNLNNVNINGPYCVGALIGFADNTNISGINVTGTNAVNNNAEYDWTGGIVGYMQLGSLKESSCTAQVNGYQLTGGLIGYADRAELENLEFNGTVSGEDYVGGIAGELSGGSLKNSNSSISVSGGEYGDYIGGLVGRNTSGVIVGCHSSGTVLGDWYIGGLVGKNYSYGSISYSHSTSDVFGSLRVGGFAGENSSDSTISRCYSTGTVTGLEKTDAPSVQLGGFLGYNGYGSLVINCFTTGDVTGDDSIGGLAGANTGYSTLENCYAANITESINSSPDYLGGLVGYKFGGNYPISCYHNGVDNGVGTVLSDDEMMQEVMFANWDFENIWDIEEGISYPFLRPMPAERYILSVETIQDITVPYGTLLSDIGLPDTVLVELSDLSTSNLVVAWDNGTPLYDGSKLGTCIFYGNIQLDFAITNPNEIFPTVKVIVEKQLNQPPVIDPIADIVVKFGEKITITPSASDPDGNTLIYSISTIPEDAVFDTSTGKLVWSTDKQDIGTHEFTITVSDGLETDSETFIVTIVKSVTPEDKPPKPPKPPKD